MTEPARSAPPQLVLFDLGNVLIALRPVREAFPLSGILAPSVGAERSVEEGLAAFLKSDLFDRFERGLAEKEEFFGALQARFAPSVPIAKLEQYYGRILGDEVEGMGAIVDELKARGVRVAGLTDTSPVHLGLLNCYPSVRALEAVVASCVTGYRKPDPRAYLEALRRLRVSPGDVFYTDDRPENVRGASAAGIRAEVFRGAAALRDLLGLPVP